MCYQLPNNCLFFFFFLLSHPICENLSPGALLYQAHAAAVILDMAGSRYRKTARAHSTQKKNIEIPLIYPRLWLQSKPVKKKKKKAKRCGGKAQADNHVWTACARNECFSHHHLQGAGTRPGCAAHEVLAGSNVAPGWCCRSGAGTWAVLCPPALLPAPSSASREPSLASPGTHISKNLGCFCVLPACVPCAHKADRFTPSFSVLP